MVDPISALCLAALTQISGSMTAAGVAGGVLGVAMNVAASRMDAMLCAVTNATAGHFVRNIREPVNHDLLKGMIDAHQRAFRHYAETLNQQAIAPDRPIADKIIALAKKDISFDITPTQALMASVTPLLAGAGDRTMEARHQEFVGAAVMELVAWVETETGETLPSHFIALLTDAAPNGRESWESKFQLHLAETIKINARYSNIFIASNIAELVGRAVSVELLAEGLVEGLVDSVTEIQETVISVQRDTARILQMVEAGALGNQIRASEIDQRAFVLLARTINLEVDDEAQALTEVTRAIELLLELTAAAERGTNYETLVDQALKRMAEKAMQGDFDDAANGGSKAFAEWQERQKAAIQSGIALVGGNIQQQVLRRDVNKVVDWIERRLRLESQNIVIEFEQLYIEVNSWLDRGRQNGSQFELRIAVEISLRLECLSKNNIELGRAQNLTGIGLWRLGEIQSGNDSLYSAVLSFDASIGNRPRSEIPLEWAKSQVSKSGVWFRIGHRDDKTSGLIESESCSRLALEECTFENAPLEWAAAHNNLGNALFVRGERVSNAKLIKEALDHFYQSLRVRTRETYEASWSMTKMNLGLAYSALGDLQVDQEYLRLGVEAIDAAISVRDRGNAPYDWAKAAGNLGTALRKQGAKNKCIEILNRSLSVQSEALKERPKEKVPLEWSDSAIELAWVKFLLADLEQNFLEIEETVQLVREAIVIAEIGKFETQVEDGKKVLKLISDATG